MAAEDSVEGTQDGSTFTPSAVPTAVILTGLVPCSDQEPSFRMIWYPSKEG